MAAAATPAALASSVASGSATLSLTQVPPVKHKGKGVKGRGGAPGNAQKLRQTREQVDKGGPADIDSQINSTMQQYQELLDHRESRKESLSV